MNRDRTFACTSFHFAALLVLGVATAVGSATGCASRSWKQPGTYSSVAEQAAAEARRMAEAEKEGLRLVERALNDEKQNRPAEALKKYRSAIRVAPRLFIAWHNLGVLAMKTGDGQLAVQALSRAAELSPTDPRPVYNLGVIQQMSGYPADAKTYYDEALDRDPGFLPALRESIRIDHQMSEGDKMTEERIRRALLIETDPEWRELFSQARMRLSERRLGS